MKGETMQIPKQQYTSEFKRLAVTRVKDGLTAGAAAKELGLVEQTLRNWVKAAAAGMLNGRLSISSLKFLERLPWLSHAAFFV